MRRNSMIIIVIFILIVSALTFASDKDIVKIQGIIMEVDLKRNMMIVNEKPNSLKIGLNFNKIESDRV